MNGWIVQHCVYSYCWSCWYVLFFVWLIRTVSRAQPCPLWWYSNCWEHSLADSPPAELGIVMIAKHLLYRGSGGITAETFPRNHFPRWQECSVGRARAVVDLPNSELIRLDERNASNLREGASNVHPVINFLTYIYFYKIYLSKSSNAW